jgi:phospholipase C
MSATRQVPPPATDLRSPVTNASNTATVATPPGPQDFLNGTGLCGDTTKNPPLANQRGRCGYGPRLPLLVISPFAKQNVVDHTVTDQSSMIRFVEDNWKLSPIPSSFDKIAGSLNGMFDFKHKSTAGRLVLDPTTGQVVG